MYSKIVAVLINSVFGICLSYSVIGVWFALTSDFVTELRFAVEFLMYNIDRYYTCTGSRPTKGRTYSVANRVHPAESAMSGGHGIILYGWF
ncbi:MAG: hypothetical protein HFH14_11240 [Lachnospiraceae bacterium]|nr:hypothetical protein [Lachnospiraceae bacterium]